jgi:hypothetical protein
MTRSEIDGLLARALAVALVKEIRREQESSPAPARKAA